MEIDFENVKKLIDKKIEAYKKKAGETLFACEDAMFEMDSSSSDEILRMMNRRCVLYKKAKPRKKSAASFSDILNEYANFQNVPPSEPRLPNLKAANLSFAARVVIAVRDKFGGEASKVYTAAKISRQAYSQIISDENRPVSKRTAVRFAFALKLSPDEARLLLKSAGYAFSSSRTEDFILQACLEVDPPIWNLDIVNELLNQYNVDFCY